MPTVLMERNNLVNTFVRVDEETKKARASAQHEVGDKEWKQGFSEEKQETARNILKEQGVGYETALKGELQGVALAETKVNGEPQQKLRVALQKGEDRILLSADLDSEFAQRLVAKLDTLSQSPQKGEITIGAFASPKERDGRHFVDHVATLKGPDGKEIPAVSGHFEQAKELSEQAKKPMLDAGITEKKILEPIADAAREKYFAGLVTEISGRLKEQGITMETGQSNNPAPRLEAHVQEPNGTWHSVGVWADKEGKLVGSVAVQRPDGEKDRIPVIFQDKVSQKGVPMLQAAGERSDGARVYVSMMPHEAKSGEKFISASFAEKHPEQELVRIEGRGGGLKPNKTAMEQGVRNRTVQLVKEKLGVNVLENARTQDRGKQEGMEIGR
ncbi:hypothetical protein [Acidithiobacillus thiooxidans]|uniref:hypothetical protein n=1 Tax=Acidithiobacillus thiooxidans TaxID=930 RepID=UPI000689D916|nr:hypothetical protein [Acidithiobacillus thiooxidans]